MFPDEHADFEVIYHDGTTAYCTTSQNAQRATLCTSSETEGRIALDQSSIRMNPARCPFGAERRP